MSAASPVRWHTFNVKIAVYVAVGMRNLLAGRLYPHRRRGVESASFGYDDRYLADPDSYALGLLRTAAG
jgi:hypothetical protein